MFKSRVEKHAELQDEKALYLRAAAEWETGVADPGLYAKAFADVGGDKDKAKARYLVLRVEELRSERLAIAEIERAAVNAALKGDADRRRENAIARASDRVEIPCPSCKAGLRLPAGRTGSVQCLHCGSAFDADTRSARERKLAELDDVARGGWVFLAIGAALFAGLIFPLPLLSVYRELLSLGLLDDLDTARTLHSVAAVICLATGALTIVYVPLHKWILGFIDGLRDR